MQTPTDTSWNRDDRDLLIELRTQMIAVRNDIKDIRDNTAGRLIRVEQEKLDRSEFNRIQAESLTVEGDHETRLRLAEKQITRILTWGSAGLLLLGLIEFLAPFFFHQL